MLNKCVFKYFFGLLFLMVSILPIQAQKKDQKTKTEVSRKNFVSFGLEISPIIPTTLFNASSTQFTNETEKIRFTLKPMLSYRFGGALRFDIFNFKKLQLGNMFTFNTGIFYTQRAFRVNVHDVSNPVVDSTLISDRFRYTSFEVPLMLQLHLQASNKIWVNFAIGTGIEFFPSQVYTTQGETGEEGFYLQYTARKFLVLAPLKASFGVEYRTEKSGYFGIGASISRPMPYMADTYLEYWKRDGNDLYAVYPYGSKGEDNRPMVNQGMFLSIDFRYYFQPSRNEKEVVPSYIRDRKKTKK
jgi:hypothetical protein